MSLYGNFVKIDNIKSKPELNGSFGVITGDPTTKEDVKRYPVMCLKGNILSLKTENLTNIEYDPNKRMHQFAIIWPTPNPENKSSDELAKIDKNYILTPMDPQFIKLSKADWTKERPYLNQGMFKMKDPTIVSGIKNKGSAKADFQIYFDAADKESPLNPLAFALMTECKNLNPHFEL